MKFNFEKFINKTYFVTTGAVVGLLEIVISWCLADLVTSLISPQSVSIFLFILLILIILFTYLSVKIINYFIK